MSAVALAILAVLIGPSAALPLDYSLLNDVSLPYNLRNSYYGNYYAPCIGLDACRPSWPFDRYGTMLTSDSWNILNPIALRSDVISSYPLDYTYSYGYPRSVDYAKENFVRGYGLGATEVGFRDEVTIRPGIMRTPFSRFYSTLFPFNVFRGLNPYSWFGGDYDWNLRRLFPFNRNTASTMGGLAGDPMYLRK